MKLDERETREAGDQTHGDPYPTHLHLMHDLQQEFGFSSSARIHQRCRLVCCMLQRQYQDLVYFFFRTLDQVLSLFFFFFKYVVVSNPFLPHWICKQAGERERERERERDWRHKRIVQFSWETFKAAASIMLPSVFSSAFHTYNPDEEEEEGEGIVVRWSRASGVLKKLKWFSVPLSFSL
jgi:hypothetical protein